MENNSNEIYAGIMTSDLGDYYLYLLLGTEGKLNWIDAMSWATFHSGHLPSGEEQTLLFNNCKSHFKEGFYWSSTVARDINSAYVGRFTDGAKTVFSKSHEYNVVAVRREFITKEDRMKNEPSVPQTPLTSKMSEEALRDEFAGRAMQSLIDSRFNTNLYAADFSKQCATIAYKFADAMMEERSK